VSALGRGSSATSAGDDDRPSDSGGGVIECSLAIFVALVIASVFSNFVSARLARWHARPDPIPHAPFD